MGKAKKGRYVRETSLQALRALEPGDYMRYVDEEGQSIWMAAVPKTWPNDNSPIIVSLKSLGVDAHDDYITVSKKIQAGFKARQSYVWSGFLRKGVWTWEE